jgi:DNA modification methylase
MSSSFKTSLKPIHPFPARMAPEIALAALSNLPTGSIVLDPMTGSGTAVRFASEKGHQGIAFDRDPLAVLMTKVWTTPICTKCLRGTAADVADAAARLNPSLIHLPWIDNDQETGEFVSYWFGMSQRDDLRCLSSLLLRCRGPIADALIVAFSRIIITKKRGASFAWDVSHSRPHKKRNENDFLVIPEFLKSVAFIAKRLEDQPPLGSVRVGIGDARHLRVVADASVDVVLTSPPYLNAIDYMRGHKFTLVWLGHTISELRSIRSKNVGSEKYPDRGVDETIAENICAAMPSIDQLPDREYGIFRRYILDLATMMAEFKRVLKPKGSAVLVIGNSCLKGVFIENAVAVRAAAVRVGLTPTKAYERHLPSNRRYLPPPTGSERSDLGKRMRTESVLGFCRP